MEQENFRPEIIETFELHHTGGFTARQQVDNILLAGASGGFTDSFLGLGLFEGILSGALAGKAIAEGLNYEQLVSHLTRQVKRRFAFREALNSMDNTGLDRLIRAITLPGIKQAIYNTNIDILGLLYPYVMQYVRAKNSRPDDRLKI